MSALNACTIPLVILAGGRATRLGAEGVDRPKFLAPIDARTTFADLQLAWVHAQGFREVVLSVGYLGELIEQFVGNGARYGLHVHYAKDGPVQLGTGGAVKRAFARPPEQLAVLYGDTLLDLPCTEVLESARGAAALMTVIACPPGDTPNASLTDGLVRYDKFTRRPEFQLIDYGFIVLNREFIEGMDETVPLDLAVSLSKASFTGKVLGWLAERPYHEINTPGALQEFRNRFGTGDSL